MKYVIEKILGKRFYLFGAVLLLMLFTVARRFYVLQIRDGEEYRQTFENQIEREQVYYGSRGIIYDRNGKELAYNELTHTITMEDSGAYESRSARNAALNEILEQSITLIEACGDSVERYLPITMSDDGGYSYTVEGTRRRRFLADVFGYADPEDLSYNERLGYEEAEATAEQIVDYLSSDAVYGVDSSLTEEMIFQIISLRYAMGSNSYQRYVKTNLAMDVKPETVAAILENQARLTGVDVAETMVRRYEDSKYFAHILGYTGPVSEAELADYAEQGFQYDRNDVVGKAGIEQSMEAELHGKNGRESFYVDNVGRVTQVLETSPASTGNNIYLTIDADLQKAVYELLEQKLAGILLANIVPEETEDTDDLSIPIQDVYYALIDNEIIDEKHFSEPDAGVQERQVYALLERIKAEELLRIQSLIASPYEELDEEMQRYMDYILDMLEEAGYYRSDQVNREAEEYERWQAKESSLEEFLLAGIDGGWISVGADETTGNYSLIEDNLAAVKSRIYGQLEEDEGFERLLYQTLIYNGTITGEQICRILLEQGVIQDEGADYEALGSGARGAYGFIREKIRDLEITPAQLALNPCTASSVVTDPNTGQVLACVTYPGYDNNRLANTVDGDYYNRLLNDASLPLYNNATQQRTAPGSTFKPITVAAGLTENIITRDTVIEDRGIFEEITPSPRCWIYTASGATHGEITVTEALRDSCNYFFYTIGHGLSLEEGVYREDKGTDTIQKYSGLFGLGESSGIEISESAPQTADEFPVVAAIGQSNHNYTTTQLARYAATLANRGNLYQLTLIDRVENGLEGTVAEQGIKGVESLDAVNPQTWDIIAEGMYMMAENNSTLNEIPIAVAGKTGTAQQNPSLPNHALFIGYAPFEQPEIAVATRIAYGYSSSNAVEVTSDIFKYYFGIEDEEQLLSGQAELPENSGNRFAD